MGHEEHKEKSPESVECAVVTVSDTREEEDDSSGKKIKEMLRAEGHEIVGYEIVKDDIEEIKDVFHCVEAQVYILNGGTGVSSRDVSPDAVNDIIDRKLPGFGELFRQLSYEDIGSPAMLSRATAGVCGDKIIFLMPGSTPAVKLGMEKLILPELGHLVYEVNK